MFSSPHPTTYSDLGPLTTAVSLPASCTDTLYDFNTTYLGINYTLPTAGCALKDCCPSGNFYTEDWAWYTSYYSPGVCPQDWITCSPPPPPLTLSSSPGETIAFCCPWNFGCPNIASGELFGACGHALPETTSVVVLNNIHDQKTVSTRLYNSSETTDQPWVVAYPIQIRFRAGDFGPTSSTPPTGDTTYTITIWSGASTPTAQASSSPSSSAAHSSALSPGAIIGVAFGAFFALFFGAILILLQRRRRYGTPTQIAELHSELSPQPLYCQRQTYKKRKPVVQSLSPRIPELQGSAPLRTYEMEGSSARSQS